MAVPLTSRPLDLVYLVYFMTHIPITILIDTYPILPKQLVPDSITRINQWYKDFTADPNYNFEPMWFMSFLIIELFLHLPFFFYAINGLVKDSPSLRLPLLIYATETATSTFAVLASLIFEHHAALTDEKKYFLISVHLPYLFLPLV
ncbi:8812_t:CDS:2, partial [Ambispora leptoticha]